MKNNRTTWKYLPLPLVIFLLGSWLAWAQAVKLPGTRASSFISAQHQSCCANESR